MPDRRPIVNPSNLQELVNTDGLIAGESAALVEQSVSPATPPSGFGVVYAKTDGKLYFKNDAGTETDLTATGGGGTDPIIREYTANDTWTKPTAANFWGVMVVCVGAGSGGGSGRRGASSSAKRGGGGGGGGAYAHRIIRSANLTLSSYTITVGAGSAGGTAITTDDTNGNNSAAGGDSSFGSLVVAKGGGIATGGTPTIGNAALGGLASDCVPIRGPFSLTGANGGGSQVAAAATAGFSGFTGIAAGAGGGGGGGIDASNNARNGGSGGAIFDASNTQTNGGTGGSTTGVRNGENGTDVANNILLDINNTTAASMGTAGGGGAAGDNAGTIAGGNGGNGGKCAGGGGGGASTNGANSGAGGNGGDGLVFVVEYYGA